MKLLYMQVSSGESRGLWLNITDEDFNKSKRALEVENSKELHTITSLVH